MQDRIDANRHGTRRKSVETPVNPLSGKLVDEAGERLVASHAQKKGRKYRYYISAFLIRKAKDETRRGWRIPAPSLEALVLTALDTFLTEPAMLTQAWRNADQPLTKLPPFIAAVQHRSQNQTANNRYDLVDHVTLSPTGIMLHISLASVVPDAPMLVHEVPITIARRGDEMRLVHERHDRTPAVIDPTLVKSVARGHRWFQQMLADGIGPDDLARTEDVSAQYIKRLVRLTFLSPGIVKSIVEGRQPAGLNAQTLANSMTIPLVWSEQATALGTVTSG